MAPRFLSLTDYKLQSFLANQVWPNVDRPSDVTKESIAYNFAVLGKKYHRLETVVLDVLNSSNTFYCFLDSINASLTKLELHAMWQSQRWRKLIILSPS